MFKINISLTAVLFVFQAFIVIGCGSSSSNPDIQEGGSGGNLDGNYFISSWTCGPRDVHSTLIGAGVRSVNVTISGASGSTKVDYTIGCKREQPFSISFPDSQTAILSDGAPTCPTGCAAYCSNTATPTSTYTYSVRNSSITTTRILSPSDISQNSALKAAHCVAGDLETRLLIEDEPLGPTPTPSSTPTPSPSGLGTPTAISAGAQSTCGIFGGAAYCWGENGYGLLGDGTTKDSLKPIQVQGLTSGTTAISVSTAHYGNHSCAIVNGAVWCWGQNLHGELGNNSSLASLIPVQVQGLSSGVTSISTGRNHTCAVVNGSAKCWGDNSNYQLGNGTNTDSSVPVQVQGLTSGVTQISAADNATCAIVNGSAKCWGLNTWGQLGDGGLVIQSSIPVQVQGLTSGVSEIEEGEYGGCAIMNGAALCWGRNYEGQLGNNTYTDSSIPVQVQGLTSGVTHISSGGRTACAIVFGQALCWGSNTAGALGNGTLNDSKIPVQVSGLTSGTLVISAGEEHGCVVVNGSAKCWGSSNYGQIGDGNYVNRYTPVKVSGSP